LSGNGENAAVTDKATITTEIETIVGGNFKIWRIGLTNDPLVHKRQLKDAQKQDVARWQQWRAASLADARDIEQTFVQNGMRSGSSASVSDVFPTYVYIF
jgi:hypothetical protein